MNSKNGDILTLGLKSIVTSLLIILLLTTGGGLNAFFLDRMLDISGQYGGIHWLIIMVVISTLFVWLPFTLIIVHGVKSFSKANKFNVYLQLFIALSYCLFNNAFHESLALIALSLPLLALILLRSNNYLNFAEFYYELQKSRRLQKLNQKSPLK